MIFQLHEELSYPTKEKLILTFFKDAPKRLKRFLFHENWKLFSVKSYKVELCIITNY